jgi:Xaa-Pro aminopeptidase
MMETTEYRMPEDSATANGSGELDRLLKEAGSAHSVADIRDWAEGLAGAPARDPSAWIEMVAPGAAPELSKHLATFAEGIRNRSADGLDRCPAPRERIDALRAEIARRGLDGFIVPLADEHQGEFVPPRAQRLAWLTGFTGSAGLAVVLPEKAAIFVDGRYTLQVANQVDVGVFEPLHLIETTPSDWVAGQLGPGARLGYDPWLHTIDGVDRFRAACDKAGAALVAVDGNPIDAVWAGQPAPPLAPAFALDARHAGIASPVKRREVGKTITGNGAACAVLSAPDSIAWLLNMRGGDIPNTPVALCYAVVAEDGSVALFIDRRKLPQALLRTFDDGVAVRPPGDLGPALDALGADGKRVQVDPATAPSWIADRLTAAGAAIIRQGDPCAPLKACKNQAELDGTRAAHVRDGASLSRFLAWLAATAPGGGVTEISAAARLYAFRTGNDLFHGSSFETISGAGANGAIVHYRVDDQSNAKLEPGSVYLVDSGAQYLDGTTDVTRTVWIPDGGKPAPDEVRDRFTRVLKGHIALATARFPAGTSGSQLDALARGALWQAGLDYDHGTGHGVGSFLGVHEGPQRISKQGSGVALQPGMIVSNEPGYYKTGAYGIRIENLIVVRPADAPDGAERALLEFETITLAPIDRALIEPALLTAEERAWLDAYHARVRETLTPLVDAETAAWLAAETRPVGG